MYICYKFLLFKHSKYQVNEKEYGLIKYYQKNRYYILLIIVK